MFDIGGLIQFATSKHRHDGRGRMLPVRVELEFEDEVGDFDRVLRGIKSRPSWK